MKRLVVVVSLIALGLSNSNKVSAQGQDTVSIMYYNLLNYPLKAQERADTLKKIIQYVLPDMFVVNELTSQAGANYILSSSMNQNGITHYQQANFVNGPDTDNLLFYNSDKIGLKSQKQIPTSLRDISEYVVYYKSPSLATTNDTIFFHVYSCHLKASSGASNETQRYNEAVTLKNYLSTQNGLINVMVGGDFNMYTSSEPAYGQITNGTWFKLYDPINQEGSWNANITFKNIHTQSTRGSEIINGGSTGGLDDRFDIIFVSNDMQTGGNRARYVANSYKAIGQDGLHFNSSLVSAPSNGQVPDEVALALRNMSDHLPVYMEFEVGGDVGVKENELVNKYTFDSYSHELNLYLENVEKEVIITVYDLTGKIVECFSEYNTNHIDKRLSFLKTGIYLVGLSNGVETNAIKIVAL